MYKRQVYILGKKQSRRKKPVSTTTSAKFANQITLVGNVDQSPPLILFLEYSLANGRIYRSTFFAECIVVRDIRCTFFYELLRSIPSSSLTQVRISQSAILPTTGTKHPSSITRLPDCFCTAASLSHYCTATPLTAASVGCDARRVEVSFCCHEGHHAELCLAGARLTSR